MTDKADSTSQTDSDLSLDDGVDDPAELLDEEQQRAFESIMSQIEGSDLSLNDPKPPQGRKKAPAVESEKKRSGHQPPKNEGAAAKGPAEQATDNLDLDEEQQKAFDSILSQIEGGVPKGEKPEREATTEPAIRSQSDSEFAVQREEVVQKAGSKTVATGEGTDQGQSLASGRQQASADNPFPVADEQNEDLRRKTGLATEPLIPSPATAEAESPPLAPDDRRTGGEKESRGKRQGGPEEARFSATTGARLNGIAAQEEAGVTTKSDGDVAAANDIVAQAVQEAAGIDPTGDAQDVSASRPSAPDPAKPCSPAKKVFDDPSDDHPRTGVSAATRSDGSPKESPYPRRKRSGAIPVLSLLLAIACFGAGCVYWWQARRTEPASPAPGKTPAVTKVVPHSVSTTGNPVSPSPTHDDNLMRIDACAQALDQFKAAMNAKREEIVKLKAYYETGIDADLQTVADHAAALKGITLSFTTAVRQPTLRLGLEAIQRRRAYVRRLQRPFESLLSMEAELSYWRRKADLLAVMASKTSDLDIDSFVEQIDAVGRRFEDDLASLAIDKEDFEPVPLKVIWKQVRQRMQQRTKAKGAETVGSALDDAHLQQEICSGNFTRKDRLTTLSPETARCLAKWEGKDLVLNRLTQLSPDAAKQLATWQGEWLALNGLTELSPSTAAQLAKWGGKVLSLNGLTRLSPQVVDRLSQWRGEQIELVNVERMAHWDNPKTRLFLSEGGSGNPSLKGSIH